MQVRPGQATLRFVSVEMARAAFPPLSTSTAGPDVRMTFFSRTGAHKLCYVLGCEVSCREREPYWETSLIACNALT